MTRRQELFNSAYNKCARLRPGQQPMSLSEEGEAVLLAVITSYDRRVAAALQGFLEHLKASGSEIPHLQAKLLFKRLLMEGRIDLYS